MARKGLNCTLSFQDGSTTRSYQVRAGNLGYGVQMIAAESEARTHRAFYPHRTAEEQFSVEVLLKDWAERADFTNWLARYAQWALDPNIVRHAYPHMTVHVPSRDFLQRGLPIQGYQWGAHTGMMMFTPVIVFEAALSPGQRRGGASLSSVINRWAAFTSDPAIQYFYPWGTQLQANEVPQNYGQVTPPPPQPPPPVPFPPHGPRPTPTGY